MSNPHRLTDAEMAVIQTRILDRFLSGDPKHPAS